MKSFKATIKKIKLKLCRHDFDNDRDINTFLCQQNHKKK